MQPFTTSRGKCRRCGNTWSVPTTLVTAERVKHMAGISYVEGLPPTCPACKSVAIAYIADQKIDGPSVL